MTVSTIWSTIFATANKLIELTNPVFSAKAFAFIRGPQSRTLYESAALTVELRALREKHSTRPELWGQRSGWMFRKTTAR